MAVTITAQAAFASGTDTASLTPAANAVGDRAYLWVSNKPPEVMPPTPAGWTLLGTQVSASGIAQGISTGDLRTSLFYMDLVGPLPDPSVVTVTGANVVFAWLYCLRASAGKVLTAPAFASGSQDSAAATMQMTLGPVRDLIVGDLVVSMLACSRGLSSFQNGSGVITPTPTGRKTTTAIASTGGVSGQAATTVGNDMSTHSSRVNVTASTGLTDSVKILATRSVSTSGYGPGAVLVQGEDFPLAGWTGFGLRL